MLRRKLKYPDAIFISIFNNMTTTKSPFQRFNKIEHQKLFSSNQLTQPKLPNQTKNKNIRRPKAYRKAVNPLLRVDFFIAKFFPFPT